MAIEYDPFRVLAEAVADVLAESGPLDPKGIARQLRLRGRGHIKLNAVNKALTQYLAGRVEPCGAGRWMLAQNTA